MTVDLDPFKRKSNADDCEGCADEIEEDDGRVTFDDPKKHKGDWGRHQKDEQIETSGKGKNGNGESDN